jgi:hypothetical protein
MKLRPNIAGHQILNGVTRMGAIFQNHDLPHARRQSKVATLKRCLSTVCFYLSHCTTVRSKPQQNQLVSVGWYLSFVVAGLQGA